MSSTARIVSINVNGIRAAYRKGFGEWLAASGADIVTVQEVRAETSDVLALVDGWHVLHDAALAKGRAGVAILSREPAIGGPRLDLATPDLAEATNTSGRWLEADFRLGNQTVTVVSTYVHSGEVDTPKQAEKFLFLEAMHRRLAEIKAESPLAVVTGDLNVGHRTLDIKNWKGNVKKSGFLPEERAWFDRYLGAEGDPDYNAGGGLGWVDVGRKFAGEVPGPYTWWSQRGQAFDTDTGWRIDYHLATPDLAARVVDYRVDRAASYGERWSDHAPVIADYTVD